jgi:phospholipid/cholesterol/gamma-HCH transport system substrate-binding protein
VECDTFRRQLERLAKVLQPTDTGGVSPLGSVINTTADNLRGQGANIRDTVIKLSQAFSALGDHSTDIFSTVKNLSILVSALQDSTTLMRQLNQNLATVTGVADNPNEIADGKRLQRVVGDVQSSWPTTANRWHDVRQAAGVTQALIDSLDDVKQFLHVAPSHPELHQHLSTSQGGERHPGGQTTPADPITFLSGGAGGIAAGRRAVGEVCVQYRRSQEPPVQSADRLEPLVGATARSRSLQRGMDVPDYIPPQPPPASPPPLPAESGPPPAVALNTPPLPAEALATNPADGLQGLMVPPGAGS